MNKKEAKIKIEQLTQTIREHNHNYYVLNSPTITDFEYDILLADLAQLEKLFPQFAYPDSPTQTVGSDLSKESDITNETQKQKSFLQHPHKYPMLSLSNTYSIEELNSFNDRIIKGTSGEFNYSCELKFDGTAICLTYKNGELVRALTRGDGSIGDDVTLNVKQIKSIPHTLKKTPTLPDEFEIRGEIYMPYSAFDNLNYQRELEEEPPFANPRNAAAGSLKQLDPEIVKERGLECTLYHLITPSPITQTHWEALQLAKEWGLPVSEHSRICNNINEVFDYINEWDTKRRELPFATDGIVIKVNQLNVQQSLGFTAKSPRWATAFKFKPEQALTPLLSVDYQVGRTGAVTPVANLEPVQLSGTMVKRASLHNADQIELLDIKIGDYVYVEKGGEIIPKITGVEKSRRGECVKDIIFPVQCPVCGATLVRDADEAKHFCPNSENCPPQIKGKFIHFISRKAMAINAGEATIEQLYNKGLIYSLSDLYSIKEEELLSLDKWKEKSVKNFLDSLEKSKNVPFERVLYALGIRHVGETTAKSLAYAYKSIDNLADATKEDLLQIDEIGEKLADSIVNYFKDLRHIQMIAEMKQAGLKLSIDSSANATESEKLKGLTIVISGNFSISREELKKTIEKHSGKVGSSISTNTNYMVAGEKCGPSKLQKAEKLGTKIISEEEFYKLIQD